MRRRTVAVTYGRTRMSRKLKKQRMGAYRRLVIAQAVYFFRLDRGYEPTPEFYRWARRYAQALVITCRLARPCSDPSCGEMLIPDATCFVHEND